MIIQLQNLTLRRCIPDRNDSVYSTINKWFCIVWHAISQSLLNVLSRSPCDMKYPNATNFIIHMFDFDFVWK